jgi:ethanolaminephosphotransferase
MTTAMQFGNSLYSYFLYCIPAIPFYIISIEEYNTKAMVLPVINAASEGTVSVAVVFAITAIYGLLSIIFLKFRL